MFRANVANPLRTLTIRLSHLKHWPAAHEQQLTEAPSLCSEDVLVSRDGSYRRVSRRRRLPKIRSKTLHLPGEAGTVALERQRLPDAGDLRCDYHRPRDHLSPHPRITAPGLVTADVSVQLRATVTCLDTDRRRAH